VAALTDDGVEHKKIQDLENKYLATAIR